MAPPDIGSKAPDFSLPDKDGTTWTLRDIEGRHTILYFYPKDDTPGCTREACGFRDNLEAFADADVQVVGVSPDDPERHARFAEKHDLPFLLLSDVDHTAAERYGVWKEKSMYGKRFWGIERTTFLLGPDATILKVYPRVRVNGHVEKVLEDMKMLVATV